MIPSTFFVMCYITARLSLGPRLITRSNRTSGQCGVDNPGVACAIKMGIVTFVD